MNIDFLTDPSLKTTANDFNFKYVPVDDLTRIINNVQRNNKSDKLYTLEDINRSSAATQLQTSDSDKMTDLQLNYSCYNDITQPSQISNKNNTPTSDDTEDLSEQFNKFLLEQPKTTSPQQSDTIHATEIAEAKYTSEYTLEELIKNNARLFNQQLDNNMFFSSTSSSSDIGEDLLDFSSSENLPNTLQLIENTPICKLDDVPNTPYNSRLSVVKPILNNPDLDNLNVDKLVNEYGKNIVYSEERMIKNHLWTNENNAILVKLTNIQQKIILLLDEVKEKLMRNQETADDLLNFDRQQQRTNEFTTRFARNYLYQIGRIIEEMRIMPRDQINRCHTRVFNLYNIIHQAIQSYAKNMTHFMIDYNSDKLQIFANLIVKSTVVCCDRRIFDKDDLLIQLISDKCIEIIKLMPELQKMNILNNHKHEKLTKKKNAEVVQEKVKTDIKNTKLSMYTTIGSKPLQGKSQAAIKNLKKIDKPKIDDSSKAEVHKIIRTKIISEPDEEIALEPVRHTDNNIVTLVESYNRKKLHKATKKLSVRMNNKKSTPAPITTTTKYTTAMTQTTDCSSSADELTIKALRIITKQQIREIFESELNNFGQQVFSKSTEIIHQLKHNVLPNLDDDESIQTTERNTNRPNHFNRIDDYELFTLMSNVRNPIAPPQSTSEITPKLLTPQNTNSIDIETIRNQNDNQDNFLKIKQKIEKHVVFSTEPTGVVTDNNELQSRIKEKKNSAASVDRKLSSNRSIHFVGGAGGIEQALDELSEGKMRSNNLLIRKQFLQRIAKNPLYINENFAHPWKIISDVADKIADELLLSIGKDIKFAADDFITEFLTNELISETC